jgi:ribosomal-protein-alanine N-acetyltransferase
MDVIKALQKDHRELTTLMRQSKSYWGYDQKQLKKWQADLTISSEFISNNHVFKLVRENKILGFFAFSIQNNDVKLESLFILPDFIGKGIGKLLMTKFLEKVEELPIKRIFLDADPNTERFYQKFYFHTVSLKSTLITKRFMPVMVKHINPSKLDQLHIFETDRMLVRCLKKDDLDDFYDMQSNPNVMRFIKPPMTRRQSKKELERFIGYYDQRDVLFRIWAVIDRVTNTFVGICGVYLNNKHEHEIAYRLREKFWGKGIASEVAKDLIRYCFTVLQYEEIVAYISNENIGSIKIAKQLMSFDMEFYSDDDNGIEFVYRHQKHDWLQVHR